jgi:stress response protein SCP2
MTHVMVKGMNVPVEASGIRAVLRWNPASGTPDVDASVVLLGENDRVRDDADFVFYNEPRHPSGLARHLPKAWRPDGLTDTVEADLAALGPDVHRVVIAASCDGGPFRQVRDLCVLLYDTSGPQQSPLVTFDVHPDTGGETALNCGELYRKDGGWKFRAVGQGYTTGLVGLATEFGITVDDVDPGEDRESPQTSAPSPSQTPSQLMSPQAQQPTRAMQAEPGPASAYGYPLQGPTGGHVPAQPAYGYPQPVAAAGPPPAVPPVHQQPQPGYPAYGYPQPVGTAANSGGPAFTLPPQGPQFQPGR